MRSIVVALALALFLNLPCIAGEHARPNFASVEAHAYLVKDDTDMVSYGIVISTPGEQHAMVKFVQKNRGKTVEIVLAPELARRIAEEAEPYVLLARRKRRFSENVDVDKGISLSIENRNRFRVSIKTQYGNVNYENDKAFTVLEALFDAESVADSWVGDLLCRPMPPNAGPKRPGGHPYMPPRRFGPAPRSEMLLTPDDPDEEVEEEFDITD